MRLKMRLEMRLVAWLVLVACLGSKAMAEPIAFISIGAAFNYEPDGRNYNVVMPIGLRAGWRFSQVDALLEFSRYSVADQVAVVQTKRSHDEWTLWARHVFTSVAPPSWLVQPYLGAGLGLVNETVETNFNGQSARDEGTPLATLQAAAGLRAILFERLNLEFEGRVGASSAYAPNPLFSLGANLGWSF